MVVIAVVPSVAGAAAEYAKPTGTFCSSIKTSECFTIADTDEYRVDQSSGMGGGWGYRNTGTGAHTLRASSCMFVYQSIEAWALAGSTQRSDTCVYVGGERVNHEFSRYLFTGIPSDDKWRFSPSDRLSIQELHSEGEVIERKAYTVLTLGSVRYGSTLGNYCDFYGARDTLGSKVPNTGLDRTPDSIMSACGFTRRQSDPAPEVTKPATTTTTEKPADTIAIPASAAKCGSVKGVTVRSTRLKCASARSVIARYARSLKSPAGWSCTAVVTDNGRRARCTRKAAGKAMARTAVYALWRP